MAFDFNLRRALSRLLTADEVDDNFQAIADAVGTPGGLAQLDDGGGLAQRMKLAANGQPMAIMDDSSETVKSSLAVASARITGTPAYVEIFHPGLSDPLLGQHIHVMGYGKKTGGSTITFDFIIHVDRSNASPVGGATHIQSFTTSGAMTFFQGKANVNDQQLRFAFTPTGEKFTDVYVMIEEVSIQATDTSTPSDDDAKNWSIGALSAGYNATTPYVTSTQMAERRSGMDHGQCRFGYVSATQCWLAPWGGNGLVINGRQYRVPSTGVYLSNAGLAAGTLYYAVAKDDGFGGIALGVALVSGGRARHTDGTWIKTGDPTQTIVGIFATSSASQFIFAANDYRVSSFFNRVPFAMGENIAGNLATTQATAVGTGFNCMCWNDQMLESQISDSSYANAAGLGVYTCLYRAVNNGLTAPGMQTLSPAPGVTIPATNFAAYQAVTVPHNAADSIISMRVYAWENDANYIRYIRCYHTLLGTY